MIINNLTSRLNRCSEAIAKFLKEKQLANGNFPQDSNYGKSFAALLWSYAGDTFQDNVNRAILALQEQYRGNLPRTHSFEFDRFAMIKFLQNTSHRGSLGTILGPERYKGTRVANWTLLRAYCRLQSGSKVGRILGMSEIFGVRYWFSNATGVIEDERGAFTMQYHAFSSALLGELLASPLAHSKLILKWFQRAIDILSALVLPGGQSNYIGRGSLQIFGYASAILAFAHAFHLFGKTHYLNKLNEVLSYFEKWQRADGSFPLVLSGCQEGDPAQFHLLDPAFPGWYSYNNYYDYLPFTGALLAIAGKILNDPPVETQEDTPPYNTLTRINGLTIIRKPSYTAVIALPNKILAASMPIPFFALHDQYPLPCYGGEQQLPSLYNQYGVPLPVCELNGGGELLLAASKYKWNRDNTFFAAWISGVKHFRKFLFDEDQILITDIIEIQRRNFVRSVRAPRLLLPKGTLHKKNIHDITVNNLEIHFDQPYNQEQHLLFGPHGELQAFFVRPKIKIHGAHSRAVCKTILRILSN